MSRTRWLDAVLAAAGALAAASLVAEYGVGLSPEWSRWFHVLDFAIVALFLMEALLRLLVVPDPFRYLRRHTPRYLIAGWLLLALALSSNYRIAAAPGGAEALLTGKLYLVIAQVYLLTLGLFSLGRIHHRLGRLRIPGVLVGPVPFVLVALVGALVLALPACHIGRWSFVDFLFTATSALCVTGLVTRSIASDLTTTGQLVVLFLIQVGGLGIMTMSAFLATMAGELRGFQQRILLSKLLGAESLATARRLLLRVVFVVGVTELLGAFLLHGLAPGWDWLTASFHSISAFCNAGFSTLPSGYEDLTGVAGVLLPTAALIVLGGLGFPVLLALPGHLLRGALGGGAGWTALEKRVVLGTVVLIGGGWAALTWSGLPGNWVDHLFQAVTPRTAGFASFPQTALGGGAMAIVIALMVIGGGPLSTAGGIRVTSLPLVGERLFRGGSLPAPLRLAAALAGWLVLLYAVAAASATIALAALEDLPLREAAFEAVSALSTVGLDRGVTAALSEPGKLLVIALMLLGRIGLPSIVLGILLPRLSGKLAAESPPFPIV